MSHASDGTADELPIWLQDVQCSEIETCLSSCTKCLAGESYECSHAEDVTVQCSKYPLTCLCYGTRIFIVYITYTYMHLCGKGVV